ncbi:MAG: gamma-glutamyl-gamma-aminobutyrate hydrolase family protein [Lachnospiraceae bacterium]|nr:gamma-glutamyl-gamma-aminobutyrate hydrolase family protein [Lachnospiraceae bacterium]
MKKIMFSQRVDIIESYGERRDCIDQNVYGFLAACGFLPVPVMNAPEIFEAYVDEIKPDGFLLTGGNTLVSYGGNAPERDNTEEKLLEYAVSKRIPVLGMCRGMQFILDHFGNALMPVEGHVRTMHRIAGIIERDEVNSFHNYAALEVKPPLSELARAKDGVIEAVKHSELPIMGIMWHPERNMPFKDEDIRMFKEFFGE